MMVLKSKSLPHDLSKTQSPLHPTDHPFLEALPLPSPTTTLPLMLIRAISAKVSLGTTLNNARLTLIGRSSCLTIGGSYSTSTPLSLTTLLSLSSKKWLLPHSAQRRWDCAGFVAVKRKTVSHAVVGSGCNPCEERRSDGLRRRRPFQRK